MVERVVHLGFEVRVELALAEGEPLWAQLTRAQAEELELAERQIVYVRPTAQEGVRRDGPADRGARPGIGRAAMELYEIAAWAMFALIFAFLGMVLGATWKQMENEAKAAGGDPAPGRS